MTPMTRRHTPGPWHFEQNRDEVTIYANNDWPVARLLEMNDVLNATLIAAAPDLLKALKAVVAIADRRTDEFDAARVAIAQAEGRGR